MDKRKEKLLADRFPDFWNDLYGDETATCMAHGFQCGDGWFQLIWNLCEEIEAALKSDPVEGFKVEQVKEKFGSLRFYVSDENPRIEHAIKQAGELSEVTCENCGSREGRIRVSNGWHTCRCGYCWTKLEIMREAGLSWPVQGEKVILKYDRLFARLER